MENALDIPSMFVPRNSSWTNEAYIRFHFLGHRTSRPEEFQNLIALGETNGKQFTNIVLYIFDYIRNLKSPLRYDVFTILDEKNKLIRPARSCFEFVENILRRIEMNLSRTTYVRDTVFVRAANLKVHAFPHSELVVSEFEKFVSDLSPDLELISKHVVY